MKLLLTRPKDASLQLQALLEPLGLECLISPLLTIKPSGQNAQKIAQEHGKIDAVVATSRRALLAQKPIDAPLYVVGLSTAHEAETAGWPSPKLVARDSADLIEKLRLPDQAQVLYLRGEDINTDLKAALPNYVWHEVITYEAKATPLTNQAKRALRKGKIGGVLFFSQRSAALFEEECSTLNLPPMSAFCLSPNIAKQLSLPCWQRKMTAQTPNKASLIDAITQTAIAPSMHTDFSMPKRRPWLALLVGVLLLSQVAMGLALSTLLKQQPPAQHAPLGGKAENTPQLDEQLSRLAQNHEQLQQELAALKEQLAESAQPTEQSAQAAALEARISSLEEGAQKHQQLALADEHIAQLERATQQVATLERQLQRSNAAQLQHIRLLTSFDRLEERILMGDAYAQALQAFSLAAHNTPQHNSWLNVLSSFQHDGLPSITDLTQRFEAAREATLDDATQPEEASLWQQVKHNMSQLIRIRKIGSSHSGDDVQSVLARAEAALQQQEYEQLESEISLLPASAHVYFEELKAAIYGRQQMLQTLDSIRTYVDAHQAQAGQ